MKTLHRKTSWNYFDKLTSFWRSQFIKPFLSDKKTFCDVGCGQQGSILLSISDKIKEGYGFDFNVKTEGKVRKNITLSRKDFLLINKKFDIIICLAVLEHLPYPKECEKVLKKIFENLKTGGIFIMTTPDKKAKWLLEFLSFRLHLLNQEEILDHKHYFDKTELLRFVEKAGFTDIKHRYFQLGLNNLVICRKK